MKKIRQILFTILFILLGVTSFSQEEEKPIRLEGADELESATYKEDSEANLLNGNVRVSHDGTKMRCNKAYLFCGGDNFDAFGRVKIKQPSGLTVTGDSLFYDTKTKIAQFRGNVKVVDKKSVIKTNYLDFDTENETAWYFGGGKINDDGTKLESGTGFYDSKQEFYSFKQDVKVFKDGSTIEADTLKYAAGPKKTYFLGPTTITSKDRVLYAEDGVYETVSQKGWFSENAWVEEKDKYKLYGDSLYFDNLIKYGYALKNVKIESYEQDADIYGDIAITESAKNTSTVIGHALMIDRSETDTTYIAADTLVSVNDTVAKKNDVFAYRSVEIIKGNLLGKCDSLVYQGADSVISFYYDPILWNTTTQITADSLIVTMANGSVDEMRGYQNSFLISQSLKDSSFFDQVAGIDMIARFKSSELNNLDVNGDGKSIYYAYDEDDILMGLNTVVCTNMKMFMVENQMDNIRFYDRPIAHFIPPQLAQEKDKLLPSFDWREDERPEIEVLLNRISDRELVEKSLLTIPELNEIGVKEKVLKELDDEVDVPVEEEKTEKELKKELKAKEKELKKANRAKKK